MLEPENLVKITTTIMPFGKYAGRPLMDLPEEYLLWLSQKEFPKGELGALLSLVLVIKSEGLEKLVKQALVGTSGK